jgi:hypothetical protein
MKGDPPPPPRAKRGAIWRHWAAGVCPGQGPRADTGQADFAPCPQKGQKKNLTDIFFTKGNKALY